ncbi:peptidyl-prolyl cis-trans isomerase [Alteraurantiacibacter aquimixticola]|nr:peptidylprolyl isomerase [Alteraurantiacibacter aquimixticola]
MRRLAREPLVHFVLLGVLLFAVYDVVNEDDALDPQSRVIEVDRETLINFLQYRSAAFEPGYFEAQYDALSEEQRAELARSYVREEAMAREAMALGLEENDYVIRRRLVQKIEYLVADTDIEPEPPTEDDLRAYFEEHRADFSLPAEYTFTHVFADAEIDRAGGPQAHARALLARLRADGANFNDAPSYGDRFPYQLNYVRQNLRPIADVFGPEFAAALDAMTPDETWQGPVMSRFGAHLVLLTDREQAREPSFEEVRAQVASAVLEDRRTNTREVLLDELVDQYDVRYAEGIPEP